MEKEKTATVRMAFETDARDILRITREAFTAYAEKAGRAGAAAALSETEEDIKGDINNSLVFVAVADEGIAGSVRVRLNGDGTAYLSRFGVGLNIQGSGVGRALMEAVDKRMRAEDVKRLSLHTASKVASSVRFYYACGFYIDSTSTDRGYIRALMCKDY
jgi:ribosomal protein S18 acetylase RimI-like enzyme